MQRKLKLKTIIVDRRIWGRGEGIGPSYLLRSKDKKMCCLGIAAFSCGIPKRKLEDKTDLRNIREEDGMDMIPARLDFLLSIELEEVGGRLCPTSIDNSAIADKLMRFNDTRGIEDSKREKELNEILEKNDCPIRFEFIN